MVRESSPDAVSGDTEAENSCPHDGLMGGCLERGNSDASVSLGEVNN